MKENKLHTSNGEMSIIRLYVGILRVENYEADLS